MSLQSGGDVDLRDIAKRRSAEVYGDPVMFERVAPSPLQQMDPVLGNLIFRASSRSSP